MNVTKFLSKEEKNIGVKYLNNYHKYNGIGFNFLGDTSISLLAIFFGANNVQLGFLSSTVYVSGILILVVPKLFAGSNYSNLFFWSWLVRGLCCLLYTTLWFTTGNTSVLIILITYTLFCCTRIIGVALFHPTVKMVTTSKNRGETIAKFTISFQLTLLLAKIVSFFVTSIEKFANYSGILALQYIGILFNTLAAFQVKKIPCREKISYQKGKNIFRTFATAMKQRNLRTAIFLNCINVSQMILLAFIVPFLRLDANFSTSMIFLYSITIVVSTILAGYFTKAFADKLGNKPLLFVGFFISTISFIIWVFLPPDSSRYVFFFLSVITGFALNSNTMLINGVIIRCLPETDGVSYNSMINFIVGIISIITGTGGGILADNISKFILFGSNSYSLTFSLAVLVSLLGIFSSIALSEPESRTKREVMGILFSPTNLQTFRLINKLEKEKDPVNRKTILLHMGKTDNDLTTKELHSIMANPYSTDKGEIIKSLFNLPRKQILKDLLLEAERPSSMYRIEAIFALGAYPKDEVKDLLKKLLLEKDSEVRSNAAKSLGRIGCNECLEEIRKLSKEASGTWNRMNYIIALKNIDKNGLYLEEAFSKDILKEDYIFRQAIYSLYSDILNFRPSLDEIFQKRNLKKGDGLKDFFDEARDIPSFLECRSMFNNWLDKDDAKSICKKCSALLRDTKIENNLGHLKNAITGLPPNGRDYDDALAVLFFTYHLLKSCKQV